MLFSLQKSCNMEKCNPEIRILWGILSSLIYILLGQERYGMFHIAVVGATGNVGRQILDILHERQFPVGKLHVVASRRSVGQKVSFGDQNMVVEALENFSFQDIDVAFFCTDSNLSKVYVPVAVKAGAVVVDKSSHFRLSPGVPLIVPEVNGEVMDHLKKPLAILANPNCVVIPLVMALKGLQNHGAIKRVVVSTYQSVSGAGKEGMDELYHQTRSIIVNDAVEHQVFSRPIAFNIIPQIDQVLHDGYTAEESKIMMETKKILGIDVAVTATCVRVPVLIGHSLSVNVEFHSPVSVEAAQKIWSQWPGIEVMDGPNRGDCVTPLDVVGDDNVWISRIRKDPTVPHGLSFWACSDNLRKGAALNGVQMAEGALKHRRSFKIKSEDLE
jgi:aspartate-semialdehyde dehydrogenase